MNEEVAYVIVNTAYYQGRRIVESAQCGHCRAEVYEDGKHCGTCRFLLDWEDEQESEHGNFMGMYN